MHPYDQAVEYIKQRNDVEEARQWLSSAGAAYGVIHELTHTESRQIIEEIYARGPRLVEVVGTMGEDPKDCSVDMVLVTLPNSKEDREMLFELEAAVAKKTGFMPSVDEGQKYILLRWT